MKTDSAYAADTMSSWPSVYLVCSKCAMCNIAVIACCTDAVRRNPVTCRATDADVANVGKEWLKHARDRGAGGRVRRAQAQARQ